ncbi:methyltransferase domain-containing protein [Gordonia sp. HNM0687]|uniref:Methyltransferase domain-containing protein n=1 Tax=Gordonia mangrovi TaxID=2665643 RepID=A0A6L7GLB8_9ACTN|nr:class I SAM-dependent methyltransferase [Gordonia mangrovi]MXP20303.1 methyltransferase domain-containing protein [Gordonia mangrovi]UVF79094.1 class I SAM-dependent methyltransferase [Gordonia mangrovi]
MGFYGDRILPHLINVVCGMKDTLPLRSRACAGLSGEVIELGFGSGINVPFYPQTVTRVAAIEPSDTGWKIAADRVAGSSIPIERAGLDGQRLPFADNTFDAALSTYTLCTIPDLASALAEVKRVVKDGGTLHFLEHGNAPDESVRTWQRRLEPIQKRVAGGCHLTRDIPAALRDAGLTITSLDTFYEEHTPKPMAAMSLGVAQVG